MRRRIVSTTFAALGLLIVSAARDASAEESAATPETTAPSPSSSPSEPPVPRRSVRVRVRLQREKDAADVMVEQRGRLALICRAPCTFDAAPGEEYRIAMDGLIEEPLVLTVPSDGTTEHDVEIRRRGDGLFVGGLVAFGAGAISLALGMAVIRGAGKEDLFGEANGAFASTLMVLGAASAVTGVALVVRRSTEPYVAPWRPLPATRAQALEDLAPGRALGATSLRPPPLPPQLGWTVRF